MPLPKGFNKTLFLQELDKRRDLCGVRVVYFDGAIMSIVREGPTICQAGLVAVVIRKGGPELIPTSAEIAQARDQRFHAELLNLGISCGGAALAWVTSFVSGIAAPVTGGASLIISSVATAAGWAGNIQCAIAVGRVASDLKDPQFNVDVDNTEWYPIVSNILDGVGLAGAAIGTAGTLKMVMMLRNTTGKSMRSVLQGLSRQERKKLTEEIIRTSDGGINHAALRKLLPLQKSKTRFDTSAINDGIRRQLMDAAGAALNVVGSASSGLLSQAVASDNEDFIVGLVNSYEVQ